MRDAALLKEKAQLFFFKRKASGKKTFFKKVFSTRQGAAPQKNSATPTKPREEPHFHPQVV